MSSPFCLETAPRITAVDPPLGPNHKGLSIRLLGLAASGRTGTMIRLPLGKLIPIESM